MVISSCLDVELGGGAPREPRCRARTSTEAEPRPASELAPGPRRGSPAEPSSGAKAFPKATHPVCRLPLAALSRHQEVSNRGVRIRITVQSGTREMKRFLRLFQGQAEAPNGTEMRRFAGAAAISPK